VLDIPAQIRTAALVWSIAPFCSARRLSNALCDRPCGSLSLAALAEKGAKVSGSVTRDPPHLIVVPRHVTTSRWNCPAYVRLIRYLVPVASLARTVISLMVT